MVYYQVHNEQHNIGQIQVLTINRIIEFNHHDHCSICIDSTFVIIVLIQKS